MFSWLTRLGPPVESEVLEESALAMAQSTIQNAIIQAGISKSDLARRMQCNRSHVSRIMTGEHNLTIKTMARALAACGQEIRFQTVPIAWNWSTIHACPTRKLLPAPAGSTMPTVCISVGIALPALAL